MEIIKSNQSKNSVTLEGRLSSKPRKLPFNRAIAYVAVSKPYVDEDTRNSAFFFPVLFEQELAEYVCENGSKGQEIYIEGYLTSRTIEKNEKKSTVLSVKATGLQLGKKSKKNRDENEEETLDNRTGGVENSVEDFEETAEEEFED